MSPIKIAIIDDHPDVRENLCKTFNHHPNFQLIEVCNDLPAGEKLIERICPDILLVDLCLPSGSGLHLIRQAQRKWGERCASAVLTVIGNEEHILSAIITGAKSYLFKTDLEKDQLDIILNLSKGYSSIQPHFAQIILNDFANYFNALDENKKTKIKTILEYIATGYTMPETAVKLKLTSAEIGIQIRHLYDAIFKESIDISSRELELIKLLSTGLSFKECSKLMQISESTAKTFANRAYYKLGANNLISAINEARNQHLIY